MDLQYLIVSVIILAAAAYAGSMLWKRSKSFRSKPGCGSDCGCGTSESSKQ